MSHTDGDKLERIFQIQKDFQTRLYGVEAPDMVIDDRIQYFKDMWMALTTEMTELADEVGWKPWATSKRLNIAAGQGELVDILCFFLNLCLIFELDAETLWVKYLAKMEENHARQDRGYDGVDGKCNVCKRDLGDVVRAGGDVKYQGNRKFCSEGCVEAWEVIS